MHIFQVDLACAWYDIYLINTWMYVYVTTPHYFRFDKWVHTEFIEITFS